MATYLVREETFPALLSVEDALVADYLAAGYREATAEEVAAWQQEDVYAGTQGPPVAPPLEIAVPDLPAETPPESAPASAEGTGTDSGAPAKGKASAPGSGKGTDGSSTER